MTNKTKKLAMLAVLCALAWVVMAVCRIPFMSAAPFLKYDPKDVVIIIGGFIYGPLAAFILSVVVSLLEMVTVSESGPIGFFMNALSSGAIACLAAFIYQKRRDTTGAVLGLASGVLATTVIMLLWNYLLVPLYSTMSRADVLPLLLPVFLPFNLVKGGLNATLAMLLYKPVSLGLRRARLIEPSPSQKPAKRYNVLITAVSAGALALFVLAALFLAGVFTPAS